MCTPLLFPPSPDFCVHRSTEGMFLLSFTLFSLHFLPSLSTLSFFSYFLFTFFSFAPVSFLSLNSPFSHSLLFSWV